VQADGEHLSLTVHGEEALPEMTRYLVAQGVDVYAITPQHLSLEELFIETVGKDGGL
jgi:ABC-2 type transport system ATP-binding protein